MTEFDSPWKEAIELYFQAFIAFFFPRIHADIDWSRGYEFLDKELQKIVPKSETGTGVVDKLVKVWRKNGEEEWVLIHVEVQSQYEAGLPKRVYRYNYRIFDRYDRTVVSLVILGDDRPKWKPKGFKRELWGCSDEFQFPAVKLLKYARSKTKLAADENPVAIIVLAHLESLATRNDDAARCGSKVRLIRRLYERGLGAEDVRRLFRLIDWMMQLPVEFEKPIWDEVEKIQEKTQMPFITTPERIGRREGLLKGIEAVLDIRFGTQGTALLQEFPTFLDHEQLEEILKASKTIASPDELRTIWKTKDVDQVREA